MTDSENRRNLLVHSKGLITTTNAKRVPEHFGNIGEGVSLTTISS